MHAGIITDQETDVLASKASLDGEALPSVTATNICTASHVDM